MHRSSRQEGPRTGIAFRLMYPDLQTFKDKLVLRNDYDDANYTYLFKILNSRFADKRFRFTSQHRVSAEFSPRVEVLLTMMKMFNENEGTDISKFKSNNSFATYNEAEELDIDNLEDNDDITERIGNRESGQKSVDETVRYSINEIINREKRLVDFITKEVMPLFSAQTITTRKELHNDKW